MVIQTSGSISMTQLRSEFVGGSAPISLASLYQNASSGYAIAVDGIPNTGVPLQVSMFYGKAKVQNYNNLVVFLDGKNTSSYPGSGVTWTDLSSKANTVTLNGNSYTSSGGGAITFNGSSSYLYRSTITGMNSSNWSAVYYLYAASPGGCIIQLNRSPSSANAEFVLSMNTFWDYNNGYGFNGASPSLSITSAGWYQVAFVKNGTTATWYLNGAANGTSSAAQDAQYGNTDFCIGKDYRDNVNFFNGYLGFMMIYNYSLTAGEIATNYTNYRARYGL
jgi:hypothetical protein